MSIRCRVAVLGAGGHTKVVLATLQALGYHAVTLFDDDPRKVGTAVLGIRVVGPIHSLDPTRFEAGVIAIGNNAQRQAVSERIPLAWLTLVHPAAYVAPAVQLGPGTVVFAGAVIQPEALIGHHVIVNTAATIDHDCTIGDFAHIGPGAHLAGNVLVEEGAFLGIASAAIPGAQIGPWSVVGGSAVVVRTLPGHVVAVGIPARATREIDPVCLPDIVPDRRTQELTQRAARALHHGRNGHICTPSG